MENVIKYNLFVNYYVDKNSDRSSELNFCIVENIKNENINKIVVICTESDYEKLKTFCPELLLHKIIPVITDVRPTFNDYFYLISKLFTGQDNVNIISNLDIIISSQAIMCCLAYMTNNKTCLALSRWDVNDASDYKNKSILFDRPDSQDTWVFIGGVPQISGASYGLGIAGCDNGIAYLLEQNGYIVLNPSKTVKTYHLHVTNIRNYTNVVGQVIERIPPPYKLINPTL